MLLSLTSNSEDSKSRGIAFFTGKNVVAMVINRRKGGTNAEGLLLVLVLLLLLMLMYSVHDAKKVVARLQQQPFDLDASQSGRGKNKPSCCTNKSKGRR